MRRAARREAARARLPEPADAFVPTWWLSPPAAAASAAKPAAAASAATPAAAAPAATRPHAPPACPRPRSVASQLNLGWNGLGDDGATALARALAPKSANASALRDVRLHHNRMSADAAAPLSHTLAALDVLDVSGNALASSGVATLLLAQQTLHAANAAEGSPTGDGAEEPPPARAASRPYRCTLMMEDCCVRPDTMLAGLLARAAAGEILSVEEMEAGGVHKAAQVAGAATGTGAAGKSGMGKGLPEKRWEPNHHAQAPKGPGSAGAARGGKPRADASGGSRGSARRQPS